MKTPNFDLTRLKTQIKKTTDQNIMVFDYGPTKKLLYLMLSIKTVYIPSRVYPEFDPWER